MKPLTALYDEITPTSGERKIARTDQIDTGTVRELERELEKKQRFVSDASHELRTPLAGLRAELEDALHHPGQTDIDQVLARALDSVDRLDAIISDLLLLSKAQAGMTDGQRRVDLATMVRAEVVRRVSRVPISLRLEPGVAVSAVPTQLVRVLTNLVDNAQRHADQVLQIQVRRDGHCAELVVEDDGDGVAEADRQRIFQRFTRLGAARDRDPGGAGLGLAIAWDIARAHSGLLRVEESAMGGARFVLRLPAAGPSGAVTRACAAAAS
ncbi:sensor histidine kinase [Actinomadura craniellae]|nr:HAMP domain-containing sensor histidine kinase [Actinomadura craniellae]